MSKCCCCALYLPRCSTPLSTKLDMKMHRRNLANMLLGGEKPTASLFQKWWTLVTNWRPLVVYNVDDCGCENKCDVVYRNKSMAK